VRDEFMITRQGKQYVLFAGLLDEAHGLGLRGIDTDLIQVPEESNGNVAIVKATAEMEDGRRFSGLGDASPDNVGRSIAPHIIRMAETRAKARALRDAVNVGATALEELSEGDDAPPASRSSRLIATRLHRLRQAHRHPRGEAGGRPEPSSPRGAGCSERPGREARSVLQEKERGQGTQEPG
jgi:hypothetical protein